MLVFLNYCCMIDKMNNLKKIRKDRKMTQEEVSSALNVSRATVSNWEAGIYEPDLTSLVNLAKLFSVSIEDILGIEAQKKEDVFSGLDDQEKEEVLHLIEFLKKRKSKN